MSDRSAVKLGKVAMTTGKRGVPKGTVNNPTGINQYAAGKDQGEKAARMELRLSPQDKHLIQQAAQKQGMSLSSWVLSVVLDAAKA